MKTHITKGLIIHYLKNLLPYQLYDIQSIKSTIIYPWNTYNITWYFYRIFNIYDSAAFDIFVSLFSFFFAWIPHPAMVFHCNFLTRGIYWYFTSSLRSSILYQFNPNFILKALYFQISPKIHHWLHYPIILKLT